MTLKQEIYRPFQICDVIGIRTPYNVMVHGAEDARQLAACVKANYVDKGNLGLAFGEGFYKYV